MSCAERIRSRAYELGFSQVGFTPAGPIGDGEHLDGWLAAGMHGDMRWMENHRELRTDSSQLHPGARTVVALAAPYSPPPASMRRGVSAYAWGDDYHEVLRARMRSLAAFIAAECGADVNPRPAVDSAPLLERRVAVEAGIGWLGKSAMVLRQGTGSYFFLAELLVDCEIAEETVVQPDRCGRCTRCIDLCPTGAIVAPYRVDARRCISYLTIELRGPIPRELRPLMGEHLFGCDVCQQVCPWNRFATAPPSDIFQPRERTRTVSPLELLAMSQEEFSTTFRRSPVKRTKRRGLARNAAVALGNRGDTDDVPALVAALDSHDEALVRGHAAWALGAIGGKSAAEALHAAASREADEYVLEELRFAMDMS